MPVVDDRATRAQHSGVYGFLCDSYEKDWGAWIANVSRSHWDGDEFPCKRILNDLRAGRTVNVPTYALPKSALAGAPTRPGPPAQYGPRRGRPELIYPARAIVGADDTVTFSDADAAALWLEENGI
jgi:hypothetical protein